MRVFFYWVLCLAILFVMPLKLTYSEEGCKIIQPQSSGEQAKTIDLEALLHPSIRELELSRERLRTARQELTELQRNCETLQAATISALTLERQQRDDALQRVLALEEVIEQQSTVMVIGGSVLGATTIASVIIAVILGMQQ